MNEGETTSDIRNEQFSLTSIMIDTLKYWVKKNFISLCCQGQQLGSMSCVHNTVNVLYLHVP